MNRTKLPKDFNVDVVHRRYWTEYCSTWPYVIVVYGDGTVLNGVFTYLPHGSGPGAPYHGIPLADAFRDEREAFRDARRKLRAKIEKKSRALARLVRNFEILDDPKYVARPG